MEEKRREAGSHSPAPTASAGSSMKSGDSPATEPPAPRRRGQKRKSTSSATLGSSSAPPKRHAREKAAAAAAAAAAGVSSFSSAIHNGPLTRARQLSDNNAAISSVLNAINNDLSTAAADAAGGADGGEMVNVTREDYEALEAAIEAEFEAIRSCGENVHVVPVAAGWFSWTKIHPIEKQTLHSFFDGKSESRTPEIYLEIRNWIMKRFHANPGTNIELKDLSELSTGDSDARQEVMEFLDHWGLINYHPFPLNDPTDIDANLSTDTDNDDKTESLIEKLYQFETELSNQQVFPRANSSNLAMPTGLFRESTTAEELVKQEGPAVEYHCNSCSADCSRKRYHCQKQADFDLCTECYNNGKFGSGMCPSDFILMEPGDASGASGGKWTDQETLLLLEALELYKENWNEIAEHVATKTKAQCILHFLQMPIEDGFLDYDGTADVTQEIAEPNSANNGVPVPKDNSDPSEGISGKDCSELAEGESGQLNSEKSECKTGENDPEPPEGKTDANAVQPTSFPMETLNLEDVRDGKSTQHGDDDIVLKVLKEAFDAVGSPPTPEESFSFAEAGNPVMALAAFLTRLVEPGVATASARSSLKLMPRSSAGSQLAARNCFVLEDPPDETKEQIGSQNVGTKIDQNDPVQSESAKNNNSKEENSSNQSEKKSTLLLDGTNSIDDTICEKDSASQEDLELPSKGQDSHVEKSQRLEKTDGENSRVAQKSDEARSQAAETTSEVKSHLPEKPDGEQSQSMEKLDESTNAEQTGQKVLKDSENPVLLNDEPPVNKKDLDDSANGASNVNAMGEAVQCTELPKDADTESCPVPSDKKDLPDREMPDAMVEVGSQAVDNMDIAKTGDPKSVESTKAKDDSNIAKLKRAALATLSAAAVKAKLLANQEEDEIRQLATTLIEKQLHKLEIKLSYFTEMENGIMRVREQLERSRQKLFGERAQIIASRLGLSASSSRVLPSSFPMNRMPPALLNSMLRPPMTMAAQRPSMPRPVMASAPLTANTAVPPEASGGSTQLPASEKPSASVGTN